MNKLRWTILIIALSACVDPINFDAQPPQQVIIVDGLITDQPGPYIISITGAVALDVDTTVSTPIRGVKITLHSDEDESEDVKETGPGIYKTSGLIRGKIGHSYYITFEMPDGSTFESVPEMIRTSGEVTDIRIQYEARTIKRATGNLPADVFNVFADGAAVPGEDGSSHVRWRFTGTYAVLTYPEFHSIFSQVSRYLDPLPCSGYEVEPALGGGKLVQKRPCTCCVCWCTQYEAKPQVTDTELVSDGQFRNVKVGEVPITRATFHDKYRVTVEQMTVSRDAFDFFKIIKNQKDGVSNLFQPPAGKLRGNVKQVNASYPIIGLFWAASIHSRDLFIHREDVPYGVAPIDEIKQSCLGTYPNATTTKPANWDE